MSCAGNMRQKTEEADANPGQEPKRCSEKAGAHPRRLSELGGFGKSGPGSLVRGSWWRLPSVSLPGAARPSSDRPSRVGGQDGGVARARKAASPPFPDRARRWCRGERRGLEMRLALSQPVPLRIVKWGFLRLSGYRGAARSRSVLACAKPSGANSGANCARR